MSRTYRKDFQINLGLDVLAALSKPGQRWTHDQINQACGMSHGWCYVIEQAALKKIRARLRRELKMSYSDMATRDGSDL